MEAAHLVMPFPLTLLDFKGLISEDRVFKDINSAVSFLSNWCQPYS